MLKFDLSHLKSGERYFYIIISVLLTAILFTSPFLRYPYDIYYHLMHIDAQSGANTLPEGRFIWHYFWAKIFDLLPIASQDIFLKAKIIHIVQTYIAFFSIYYFSHVVIRNIFPHIEILVAKYLALWSVIIWSTIYATYSVHYQLVWTLWYSVNYQITLPLFWYITALTLVLFLEKTSLVKKIFFIILILLLSRFILQAHSMEFMYYLMYLGVLGIVYADRVWLLLKKYFYFFIPVAIAIAYMAKAYQPEKSKLLLYFTPEGFPFLYDHILQYGHYIVNGHNRASASINELMVLILVIGIITTTIIAQNNLYGKKSFIHIRLTVFVLLTSLFVLIPLFEYSAGLFGIITNETVVHRIYYSASLFVLLPIFVYILYDNFFKENVKILYLNLSIIFLLISTVFYSKYFTEQAIYYQNIKSIQNSFFTNKYRFHLSDTEITAIGKTLQEYESNNHSGKSNFYFARDDIAFVLKYIYRKNVYFEVWEQRTFNPDLAGIYQSALKKGDQSYNLIRFETPKGFPPYTPYE